ncbi:hypothetical protein [Bacteroides stercorirosoris]|uniref:hypothetical protein n=1 Tax=Bacteroides stercorirosoris TaxID=871324 RepID=UPI003521F8EA
MSIRLFGAGVPVTTGYKGRVPYMQGCREKYRSPPGEDDFSTTPEGLDLACTIRTRVTFACELRGLGYGMAVMPDMDYL